MTDWFLNISHHFKLGEFVPTDRAAFLRLDAWGRTRAITNFGKVANALERIRADLGTPILITSGWRSKEHNRAVGGAVNSDHMTALAVDFNAEGIGPRELYEHCLMMKEAGRLGFDQLIGYSAHVHIGMADRMRGMHWSVSTP